MKINSLKHLRQGRAIRLLFFFPPPNELCCKIFCSSNSRAGTKSKTTSVPTWEEGHGSSPSLLEDAGLASAHTTNPVLIYLLTCFTFMLPQHRGIPNSCLLKLNSSHSDRPKVLLVEGSAPDPAQPKGSHNHLC